MYRSQVHCEHAISLACLMPELGSHGHGVQFLYRHTSNLPQGRSLWLRTAIVSSTATYAITVDSDTAFDAKAVIGELEHMSGNGIAIGIVPVVRNIGRMTLNIFMDQGRAVLPSSCGGNRFPLWGGGFGMAVFNLAWFRSYWREPFPEVYGINPEDAINQGEDIQMCRSVVERGGKIIPLWIPTAHYDMSGYSVVGGELFYNSGKMHVRGGTNAASQG